MQISTLLSNFWSLFTLPSLSLGFAFLLSLAIFVTGITFAVRKKTTGNMPWQSLLLIVLIVTAIAMWITVLPLLEEGGILYKILYGAFYVMESAVADQDYNLFVDALPSASFWRVYTIFLHLLMPITAYGVILVYFLKVLGWFRFTIFRGKKKIIMFSDLTEKSKDYASRIDDKNTLLIFTNTDESEEESFDEDRSGNMIFTDQSEIQTLKQLSKHDLTIMEMGEDENENLVRSVEIIHYLKGLNLSDADQKTISLYTVTHLPEAATILDNVMGRGTAEEFVAFRHTVINEFKRIAFKLLYDNPLYDLIDEDTKKLDIMIIGFGRMGQEVLKAISWAGSFPDIDVSVHVLSLHGVENGEKLLSNCPELGEDLRHEGGFMKPENGKQLNEKAPIYYYSVDADSPEFDRIVRGLVSCRYIVLTLDEDTATISKALHVYRLIMRERYLHGAQFEEPKILVRIRDNDNLQMLDSKEDKSIFNHFVVFGSDEDIYSKDRVGESDIEPLAEQVHGIYMGENKQNDERAQYAYLPETAKNSNQAAALHTLYKLNSCRNITFEKLSGDISPEEAEQIHKESVRIYNENVSEEERQKMAKWEHIRWQAYMRTEGYIYCPYEQTEKIYRSFTGLSPKEAAAQTRKLLLEARMHPCIGDVDTHLRKISLLLKDPKDPEAYARNDRAFVDSAPKIIKGSYRIVPKNPAKR